MTKANVTVKASIKSTLAANDVDGLAAVLAKAGDKAAVQKMGLTFSLAVKKAQDLIKAEEKRLAGLREAAEKAIAEAREARELEASNMLKHLTDEMGLDLAVASDMVVVAMEKKYPAPAKEKVQTEKSFTFNRVAIDYNGTAYDMPTTGNMPNAWKDRVSDEFGDDRTGFILKYAVDKSGAAEVVAQKNGVTE